MIQKVGCMTIDEIKELVVFMKRERVESFEVGVDLKVNFSNAAFIGDFLSDKEIPSKSAEDIAREEEELLYAST